MDKRLVILNLFQDNGPPSRVIPKQVRDDNLTNYNFPNLKKSRMDVNLFFKLTNLKVKFSHFGKYFY